MKAYIVPIQHDGTEGPTMGVTKEYKGVHTLVRYGAPKNGAWNLHVHYNWDDRYKPADTIIRVKDGTVCV